MDESSTTTASIAAPFYLWQNPSAPFRVRLHLNVIDRMQAEIARSLPSGGGRGREAGGILFGKAGSGVVEIFDFEPVECSNPKGPSYHLAEADKRNLQEKMAKRSGQVIGFYRTHTRGLLFLDDEDRALIRACFSDPKHVFLIVGPSSILGHTASFFFWDQGQIRPEFSFLEFPFDSSKLPASEAPAELLPPEPARAEPPLPQTANLTLPPEEPRPSPVVEPPQLFSTPPKRGQKRLWFTAAAILCFLAAGSLALKRSDYQKQHPLALQVERSADDLRVTWNRSAPLLERATAGVLSIRDGDYQKEMPLDPVQLQTGSLFYMPASNHVQFRLEVLAPGERVSESVMVLRPEVPR